MSRRILIGTAALLALLPGCSRETGSVVARVGRETLTREQIEQQLPPELARHAGREVYLDLARRWIRQKLLAQEARRLDLDNDPSVQRLLADREDEALADVLLMRLLDSVPESNEPQLRKYYEQNQQEFLRSEPEVGFRRIRLPDQPTAVALAKTLSPANFATEALRINPEGGSSDAQRMWRRSELPPSLADALFSMQEGSISEPIQTAEGWCLFLLVSRAPAGSVRPFQDVVDLIRVRIAEGARRRRLDDIVARLSRQGGVELLSSSLPGTDSAQASPSRK